SSGAEGDFRNCASLLVGYLSLWYEKKLFMLEGAINITTTQSGDGHNARRLWLVRHGLTDWNMQQRFCGHRDIPLSAQGRAQALWTAEQLLKESISAIYTSDLVRARETAEI